MNKACYRHVIVLKRVMETVNAFFQIKSSSIHDNVYDSISQLLKVN